MAQLNEHLDLERCPHCGIDKPTLARQWNAHSTASTGRNSRHWKIYKCARCGGLVLAGSDQSSEGYVTEIYPSVSSFSNEIPSRAKEYLEQAASSLHAPAGAVMLAASAIDAMLKDKGLKEGKLYPRIKKAADEHLITEGMAKWAHQVRLDANDERHADEDSSMASEEDAKRAIDFAQALAEFLFVLPSRVTRGITSTQEPQV